MDNDPLLGGGGRFSEFDDNACLATFYLPVAAAAGVSAGYLELGAA